MTTKQVLDKLKEVSTEQNRKVNACHGIRGRQYGVGLAELGKLRKTIGTDHKLALGLWKSGVHDARVLACMIADPDALGAKELDAWARELDNYVLTDAFSALVARGEHVQRKYAAWKDRRGEWFASAGWTLLGSAAQASNELPDEFFTEALAQIEAEIHVRPNRVRYAMNQAVISIGVRNESLRKAAQAALKRIGRVIVDHGETGCKTPDAALYIRKTIEYRARARD
jgi:3-methyladenine DNA glycosylase AlkD